MRHSHAVSRFVIPFLATSCVALLACTGVVDTPADQATPEADGREVASDDSSGSESDDAGTSDDEAADAETMARFSLWDPIGWLFDAGTKGRDAGTKPDAGGGTDAGSKPDAGPILDAGSRPDAGGALDAGAPLPDAAADGGSTQDAGSPPADGGPKSPQDTCVDQVNRYRATLGLPALKRWTAQEACTDGQAQTDALAGKAHTAFGQCGEYGQCECPGWSGTPTSMISPCLAAMWAEGPGGGHYDIMSSTRYTMVSCGFYVAANGKVTATQDYK